MIEAGQSRRFQTEASQEEKLNSVDVSCDDMCAFKKMS